MIKPNFIKNLECESRKFRYSLFVNLLKNIDRPVSILDVGGVVEYWERVGYEKLGEAKIVLLNIFEQKDLQEPFSSVIGDARDLSRFQNGAFDVVFSNAVLGLVGSYHDQQKMAKEMARVGKRYFLQTPNKGFPIDWRTLMPFFHYLPASVQCWCFQHFRIGVYPKVKNPKKALHLAKRVRDIRKSEIEQLFPRSEVIPERFLGFTKSFVIHFGFHSTL